MECLSSWAKNFPRQPGQAEHGSQYFEAKYYLQKDGVVLPEPKNFKYYNHVYGETPSKVVLSPMLTGRTSRQAHTISALEKQSMVTAL